MKNQNDIGVKDLEIIVNKLTEIGPEGWEVRGEDSYNKYYVTNLGTAKVRIGAYKGEKVSLQLCEGDLVFGETLLDMYNTNHHKIDEGGKILSQFFFDLQERIDNYRKEQRPETKAYNRFMDQIKQL